MDFSPTPVLLKLAKAVKFLMDGLCHILSQFVTIDAGHTGCDDIIYHYVLKFLPICLKSHSWTVPHHVAQDVVLCLDLSHIAKGCARLQQ